MNQTLERFWVSILNSDRFRHFMKKGAGSVFFRSRAYQKINLVRNYLATQSIHPTERAAFQDIRTFCLFIGHNKSGTSLIGSLLDAHPNIILSDESNTLQYIPAGFRREQIFHLLVKNSRRESMKGRVTARRLTPYSFFVPGQWQGQYHQLRVIGDGTAGTATRKFGQDPGLLQRLQQRMAGLDVKFIQVIRNPYDPISVMMIRGNRTFENAAQLYFSYCEILSRVRRQLDPSQLLAVRYEDFILDPELNLSKICTFLGVEAESQYLQSCTSILKKTPDRSRHLVPWDSGRVELVKNKINEFDFLEGYSFEG